LEIDWSTFNQLVAELRAPVESSTAHHFFFIYQFLARVLPGWLLPSGIIGE
jgi:hypothetical protein